jgi:hypothetical protein
MNNDEDFADLYGDDDAYIGAGPLPTDVRFSGAAELLARFSVERLVEYLYYRTHPRRRNSMNHR